MINKNICRLLFAILFSTVHFFLLLSVLRWIGSHNFILKSFILLLVDMLKNKSTCVTQYSIARVESAIIYR